MDELDRFDLRMSEESSRSSSQDFIYDSSERLSDLRYSGSKVSRYRGDSYRSWKSNCDFQEKSNHVTNHKKNFYVEKEEHINLQSEGIDRLRSKRHYADVEREQNRQYQVSKERERKTVNLAEVYNNLVAKRDNSSSKRGIDIHQMPIKREKDRKPNCLIERCNLLKGKRIYLDDERDIKAKIHNILGERERENFILSKRDYRLSYSNNSTGELGLDKFSIRKDYDDGKRGVKETSYFGPRIRGRDDINHIHKEDRYSSSKSKKSNEVYERVVKDRFGTKRDVDERDNRISSKRINVNDLSKVEDRFRLKTGSADYKRQDRYIHRRLNADDEMEINDVISSERYDSDGEVGYNSRSIDEYDERVMKDWHSSRRDNLDRSSSRKNDEYDRREIKDRLSFRRETVDRYDSRTFNTDDERRVMKDWHGSRRDNLDDESEDRSSLRRINEYDRREIKDRLSFRRKSVDRFDSRTFNTDDEKRVMKDWHSSRGDNLDDVKEDRSSYRKEIKGKLNFRRETLNRFDSRTCNTDDEKRIGHRYSSRICNSEDEREDRYNSRKVNLSNDRGLKNRLNFRSVINRNDEKEIKDRLSFRRIDKDTPRGIKDRLGLKKGIADDRKGLKNRLAFTNNDKIGVKDRLGHREVNREERRSTEDHSEGTYAERECLNPESRIRKQPDSLVDESGRSRKRMKFDAMETSHNEAEDYDDEEYYKENEVNYEEDEDDYEDEDNYVEDEENEDNYEENEDDYGENEDGNEENEDYYVEADDGYQENDEECEDYESIEEDYEANDEDYGH